MKKYSIVIDTSFNLSQDEINRFGVDVIPLHAYINEKEIDVDITEQEFFETFFKEEDANVRTAAPSIGEITDAIKNAKTKSENVIVLTVGSQISSTHQYALKASQEFKNVHVLDSRGAFAKNKIIFDYLCKNLENDLSIKQILENTNELIDNIKAYFIINDLKYLKKSGRVSAIQSLMGDLLSIKPILTITKEGKIENFAKIRTQNKAVDKLVELIECEKDVKEVYITTLDEKPLQESFIEKFNEKQLNITLNQSQYMPAVVGVHTGPKVFVMGYLSNSSKFNI